MFAAFHQHFQELENQMNAAFEESHKAWEDFVPPVAEGAEAPKGQYRSSSSFTHRGPDGRTVSKNYRIYRDSAGQMLEEEERSSPDTRLKLRSSKTGPEAEVEVVREINGEAAADADAFQSMWDSLHPNNAAAALPASTSEAAAEAPAASE